MAKVETVTGIKLTLTDEEAEALEQFLGLISTQDVLKKIEDSIHAKVYDAEYIDNVLSDIYNELSNVTMEEL